MSKFFKRFASRKAPYQKRGGSTDDTREQRMYKLKMELRDHIRYLHNYDVMSLEWLRMAESLHQVCLVLSVGLFGVWSVWWCVCMCMYLCMCVHVCVCVCLRCECVCMSL